MPSPAQHYREAEAAIKQAQEQTSDDEAYRLLLLAQVHATLATATSDTYARSAATE
jgi:hypothetical protein